MERDSNVVNSSDMFLDLKEEELQFLDSDGDVSDEEVVDDY